MVGIYVGTWYLLYLASVRISRELYRQLVFLKQLGTNKGILLNEHKYK